MQTPLNILNKHFSAITIKKETKVEAERKMMQFRRKFTKT